MEFKIIAIGMICLLFGFAVGYSAGVGWALNWGVGVAFNMLEKQGIKIEFNPSMIAAGIYQYKNNLGGVINCDFGQNASLYNTTGN